LALTIRSGSESCRVIPGAREIVEPIEPPFPGEVAEGIIGTERAEEKRPSQKRRLAQTAFPGQQRGHPSVACLDVAHELGGVFGEVFSIRTGRLLRIDAFARTDCGSRYVEQIMALDRFIRSTSIG